MDSVSAISAGLSRGYVVEDEGQVVELRVRFHPENFAALGSILQSKYGAPEVSENNPWQSKGGVRTMSHFRGWRWAGLMISIRAPTRDIYSGDLVVISQAYVEKTAKERRERLRKSAEDL
jgi:hypothetical protein